MTTAAGPDSYFRFTCPEDAEYVLWVVDHLRQGRARLRLPDRGQPGRAEAGDHPPTPSRSPSAPGRWPCAVPKGNRQAILILGSRADFGGDLNLGVAGAPAGRRHGGACRWRPARPSSPCSSPPSPTPPLAGTLAGLGQAGGSQAEGAVASSASTAALVLGQNNIIVWSRTVDRLAVAVTEECPYTIEIVEPKVPLVRGGSMGLKVRANRKPGFKAAISVYLPWNPPGVGSAAASPSRKGRTRRSSP